MRLFDMGLLRKLSKKKNKSLIFLKCLSNTTKHIEIRRPEEVGFCFPNKSMEFSESNEQLYI